MFDYIILGIVQGLTEFLPVSSSGHLVLANYLFGFENIDPAFSIFVQGGTVISVLIYFRKKILHLSTEYAKLILIASIPAAIVGLFLSDYIDYIFTSLWGITLGFAITTIVVLLSRRRPTHRSPLAISHSLIIGLAQATAILPGLSRSGSTITASLMLGISSAEAFAFSFLLSIPTIAGASLLSLRSITWNSSLFSGYLVGFVAATVTGYISLTLLAKLIKKGKFYQFAPYTTFLTLFSLLLAISH